MKKKDAKGRILRQGEYQKPSGIYEFRFRVDGVRRSVYSNRLEERDPTPKGKKECKPLRVLEAEILRDLKDGIRTFDASKITLNSKFDEYIDNAEELLDSTKNNYVYMYNRFVRGTIGTYIISEVNFTTILNFYKNLVHKKNLEYGTVGVLHNTINPVFEYAVRDHLIRENPCNGVMKELKKSSKKKKPERDKALEQFEQKNFMEFISNHKIYKHWETVFTVLFWTGMRIGEFTGLTWNDVHFENNTISVNHTLLYKQNENKICKYSVHGPKTGAGERTIPMLPPVKQAFLSEKERQKKVYKQNTIIDGYSNWTFLNRDGTVFNATSINRAIKRIVSAYNAQEKIKAKEEKRKPVYLPDFSVHECRHTFCTRLCERIHNIPVIQKIMGHKDVRTTMEIYNSVSEKLKQDSFADLATLISC